jgi:hypothetical protein
MSYPEEIEALIVRFHGRPLSPIEFDRARQYEEDGIPITVVLRGIEQRAMRQMRTPFRLAYCNEDILEAYDDWKRAIGPGR